MKISAFFSIFFVTVTFIAGAQSSDSVSKVKYETKAMSAPVIKPGRDLDAANASYDGNISFHVVGSPNSNVTAERLAKGFVNAFANRDITGGRPMYVTGVYETDAEFNEPLIAYFINGVRQRQSDGSAYFTVEEFKKEVPKAMAKYVEEFGTDKLIPEGVQPILIN